MIFDRMVYYIRVQGITVYHTHFLSTLHSLGDEVVSTRAKRLWRDIVYIERMPTKLTDFHLMRGYESSISLRTVEEDE
jgi:hypothetical protein